MNVLLAGNGLSIAYNADLALPNLTPTVLDAFNSRGASDGELLTRFAASTGADDEGLESVLGSLDQIAAALLPLQGLSALDALGDEARHSVAAAASALEHVYTVGAGTALEVIANLAHGRDNHDRAAEQLVGTFPTDEALTVATLNYDGILPSRVLDQRPGYDLAAGYEPCSLALVEGGPLLPCQRLRTTDDLDHPTVLLNLHGSLGWLWHPNHQWWKFTIGDLRQQKYWSALQARRTQWLPAVILTNQAMKSQLVRQYPFNLAYGAFVSRLRDASRLVIAGYGFRDEYLNHVLASTIAQHDFTEGRSLKIAVIDKGNGLADHTIHQVVPRQETTVIFRDGVAAALTDSRWTKWFEADPDRHSNRLEVEDVLDRTVTGRLVQ